MTKHRANWKPFKYPISVYIYTGLNRWYCFIKPRMKAWIHETIGKLRK